MATVDSTQNKDTTMAVDNDINSTGKYTWYFAYGSNNSYEQLLRRLGNIGPNHFDDVDAKKNDDAVIADAATTTATQPLPLFGGVHNQCTDTTMYPPLAIKVVLLPNYYFVIDAPSATKGLGYANLRKRITGGVTATDDGTNNKNAPSTPSGINDPSHSSITTHHEHDAAKSPTELLKRPPFVVSVAYLLSEAQLLMMDKFENAPDKYHRERVRGIVLKDVDPLPRWVREGDEDGNTTAEGNGGGGGGKNNSSPTPQLQPQSPSPTSPSPLVGVVSVPRDPTERAAIVAKVHAQARALEEEMLVYFGDKAGSSKSNDGGADAATISSNDASPTTATNTSNQRALREAFFNEMMQTYEATLAKAHGGGGIGGIAGSAHDGVTTTANNNSAEGSPSYVIEGVAYIYEGTGLLHTDVVESNSATAPASTGDANGATTTNASATSATTTTSSGGWKAHALDLSKATTAATTTSNSDGVVGIQPSSSYMGRILEGEYFFDLLEELSLEAGQDDTNNTKHHHHHHSRKIANKLLAAYVHYLQNIEVSAIPSPRTLLRAAGKV